MNHAQLLAQQRLFARVRWVGVVLFGLALPVLPLVVWAAAQGQLRWILVLPSIGCLGLSLGAFGTANDTSLHAARAASALGPLPPEVASELAHEEAVRPARLRAIHASPKASFVIPVVALGLILWMARNLVVALAG
jgi:hypothetical protein